MMHYFIKIFDRWANKRYYINRTDKRIRGRNGTKTVTELISFAERKMKLDDLVKRINELSAKSRTPEGLTPEEVEERQQLRQDYVSRFRESLRAELDNTVIVYPDGTRKSLRKQ